MNPLRRIARFISNWPFAPLMARAVLLIGATVVLARIGQGALHRLDEVAVPPVYAQSLSASPPQVAAGSVAGSHEPAKPQHAEGEHTAAPTAPASAATNAPNDAAPSCQTRACDGEQTGITADGRIILNRASIDEFIKLPGVGRRRAEAIVALRKRLGRFRRVRDLLRVRGIGFKSLRKLKPLVVLDAPEVPPTGSKPATHTYSSQPDDAAAAPNRVEKKRGQTMHGRKM